MKAPCVATDQRFSTSLRTEAPDAWTDLCDRLVSSANIKVVTFMIDLVGGYIENSLGEAERYLDDESDEKAKKHNGLSNR